MTYEQARSDHEYLWQAHGPASDMTGGYVDQEDLKRLLESPTKATATACYRRQVAYWCQVGPESDCGTGWMRDPMVVEIADRHGYGQELDTLLAIRRTWK